MPTSKNKDRQMAPPVQDDGAERDREGRTGSGDVRQDDELTNAERLPRRGDHEMPPGKDTSV